MKLGNVAPGVGEGTSFCRGIVWPAEKLFTKGKHCIDQSQSRFSKKSEDHILLKIFISIIVDIQSYIIRDVQHSD